MMTINKILESYGVVPHPRIKGRFTLVDREFSVVVRTKKELVSYVRHPDFDIICSVYKHERYYYTDGTLKEPRDAQWFKENYPEFYEKCFTDQHLHLDRTVDVKNPRIKEDLDIYQGFAYAPYVEVSSTPIFDDLSKYKNLQVAKSSFRKLDKLDNVENPEKS